MKLYKKIIIIIVVGFILFNVVGILGLLEIVNYNPECLYWVIQYENAKEEQDIERYTQIAIWIGENCR